MNHYYKVELRHFSGGVTPFIFSCEQAALDCMAHYRQMAENQAATTGGEAMVSTNHVALDWSSPAGYIRWSASMLKLGFDDNSFKPTT